MAQTARAINWVNDILAGLVSASGVGYLATAYSISRWLTRATPAIPEPPPRRSDSWESLACTTSDGLRLAGWVIAPARPRGTVALFHGLRQNRTQTLGRIDFLVRAGWRCVTFDHRAHGQSDGKQASFGWFEARDVAAVSELIRQRWQQGPKVALGISMGAAAICFAADMSLSFDAFILESVYHDLVSAFRHRVGCGYPTWFKRFSRGIIWVTQRRLGLRLANVSPAEHVHRLAPRPVLLVTGGDDAHAPPADVGRVFERCGDPREFHVIAGAGHKDLDTVGGRRYEDLVLAFLDRHLSVRLAA